MTIDMEVQVVDALERIAASLEKITVLMEDARAEEKARERPLTQVSPTTPLTQAAKAAPIVQVSPTTPLTPAPADAVDLSRHFKDALEGNGGGA